jgi:hypothetical protein
MTQEKKEPVARTSVLTSELNVLLDGGTLPPDRVTHYKRLAFISEQRKAYDAQQANGAAAAPAADPKKK